MALQISVWVKPLRQVTFNRWYRPPHCVHIFVNVYTEWVGGGNGGNDGLVRKGIYTEHKINRTHDHTRWTSHYVLLTHSSNQLCHYQPWLCKMCTHGKLTWSHEGVELWSITVKILVWWLPDLLGCLLHLCITSQPCWLWEGGVFLCGLETTTAQACLGYVSLGHCRAARHTRHWWGPTRKQHHLAGLLCTHLISYSPGFTQTSIMLAQFSLVGRILSTVHLHDVQCTLCI